MAARGNVFAGMLDYSEEFSFLEEPLSARSASELLVSMTHDERMAIFKKYVAR
jgi:hypothetical protein